ncbi:hypothetical protein [Chryseobacterium lineare]
MAIAACKISFKIKYTSSLPITKATAFYRIKNSPTFTEYVIPSPIPVSDVTLVELPEILTSGEYDLMVELGVNGVTATQTSSFQIGKCNPLACNAPSIKNVYLGENDQIIMDYSLDTTNLYAVQYQIATDSDFKNIVQLKVIMASDYNSIQYIEMNDGTIKNNTQLYIRVRKYCSLSDISDWSNIKMFVSGTWVVQKNLYPFDAYCVSDTFNGVDPTDIREFKASICIKDGNPLMKKVNLTTSIPQEGSFIYTNGLTPEKPAIPGSLASFDDAQGGVSTGFNQTGIRWIRFENNPALIYDVNPKTGQIAGVSGYKCNY